MKKLFFLPALLILCSQVNAQIIWPSAYTLSGGNYSLNTWSAASAANSYPAAMRFYNLGTTGEPGRYDTIYQNYTAAYNQTSGTRINGLDSEGFSFINTGNSVYKEGAAVLALNTINRNTVAVTWTGKTVTPNFRTYEIRLYYRTDTIGAWTTVLKANGDTVRYVRSPNVNDSSIIGPVTLPTAVNNKAIVQLCWKYFQVDSNTATGARGELSVDRILVTSAGIPSPAILTSTGTVNAFIGFVNNATYSDSFTVSGSSLTANVTVTATSGFEISSTLAGAYGNNLTLTQTSGTLASSKVYVRFHPTSYGTFTGSVACTSTGASTQNVVITGTTYSSLNPAAFKLSTGNYNMMQWDSLSAAGTYPANMAFHVSNIDTPALLATPLFTNWTCAYNLTNRPRIIGLDSMGFAFLNTGSPQYDNCNSGTTMLNTYMGAAILAVNTVGVSSIKMKYNVGLIIQGDGLIARVYNVRLQYRKDSLSNFTDYSPVAEYTSLNGAAGDLQPFSMTLPSSLENVPYLQFRWLYYAISVNGSNGSRPEIRIDNIAVTTGTAGVETISQNGNSIVAFPNPVSAGQDIYFTNAVSGRIFDIYGRAIQSYEKVSSINTSNLASGMYSFITNDGKVARIVIK